MGLACGTLGAGLVGVGLVGVGAAPAGAAVAQGTAGQDVTSAITRAQILARAATWVAQKVPYSQVAWWSDANGAYRQDCSGYVSMAWGLSQRVNYWTGNLATVSHRIPSSSLQPGDILLKAYDHTVIFSGWANAERTRFNMYEQYRRGYPARHVLGASLSNFLGRGFGAYRYNGVAVPARAVGGDIALVAHVTPEAQGVPWSADAYDPETSAPAALPEAFTPPAVENLPVEVLTQAQRAMDTAHLTALQTGTRPSTRGDLVLAGLGLMFLAAPLSVAVRAGAWSPVR